MNRVRTALAVGALLIAAGCGGGSSSDGSDKAATKPTSKALGNVSSVVALRDALIAAGYDCPSWKQDNIVKLAAESGSCDDDSVLSTFASDSDLQAQLDTTRALNQMSVDANVQPTPVLVGPNWMFSAPEAGEYASEVGGTVVSPPTAKDN